VGAQDQLALLVLVVAHQQRQTKVAAVTVLLASLALSWLVRQELLTLAVVAVAGVTTTQQPLHKPPAAPVS
jgi:hypothetical protein